MLIERTICESYKTAKIYFDQGRFTEMVEKDQYGHDAKETTKTGSDLPKGDGTTSDEGFNAISGKDADKPIGQDHSLDNYEDSEPRDGVGAVQNSSLINSNIAHIEDEGE